MKGKKISYLVIKNAQPLNSSENLEYVEEKNLHNLAKK